MSAAPSGRRKRPRSAASIFQGSRTSPHGRDSERRGSGSDSAYQIQRTLDDCKMVGTPGRLAVVFYLPRALPAQAAVPLLAPPWLFPSRAVALFFIPQSPPGCCPAPQLAAVPKLEDESCGEPAAGQGAEPGAWTVLREQESSPRAHTAKQLELVIGRSVQVHTQTWAR